MGDVLREKDKYEEVIENNKAEYSKEVGRLID